MNKNAPKTQNIVKRINEVTEAWSKHAPEAKFAGMTLLEFQLAINPTLATRQGLNELRVDLKGQVARRKTLDNAAREMLRRVVGSVIADASYGANSPLYRAMNYVTLDDRKSGLTRNSNASAEVAPTTDPTAPAAASTAASKA